VDGTNPLAVADAVARKRRLLLEGEGPALLDVECYRFCGHSTTDANAYRTREEIRLWEEADPIRQFADALSSRSAGRGRRRGHAAEVSSRIEAVTRAVVDPRLRAPVDVAADPTRIGRLMFSHRETTLPTSPAPGVGAPASSAALRALPARRAMAVGEDGAALAPLRAITLRDALAEAILHHMIHDERLVAWGEECREWGGAFGVYRGFADILPHHRLFNAPISEAAIVAAAVGHAMEGGRSLVELMYGDFIGRAGDEIFNQMAKWQAMSGGHLSIAGGPARLGRIQVWRPAFAGLDRAHHPHPGPQGRLSRDAL
jgi:2-oxoisovalerate dehydrogenase E1 component